MVSWLARCFWGFQEAAQVPGDSASSSPGSQPERISAAARTALTSGGASRLDGLLASTLDMDRFVEPDQIDGSGVTSLEDARQLILRLKARVQELEGSAGHNADSTITSLRHIRLPEQESRVGPTPASKRGNGPNPSGADAVRDLHAGCCDDQKSVPYLFCTYTKQELVELLGRAGKPSAAVLLQAICEEGISGVPPALLLDVDPAVGDSIATAPELVAALKNGVGSLDFSQLVAVEHLPNHLRLRLHMLQASGARPMLAYATSTARALFKVRTDRQLQYVLEGQVQQDAILGMLLQEMLDEMLTAPVSRASGVDMRNGDKSSTIVVHSFSHFVNTSNPKVFPFVPVTMRPCGYKKTSGEVVPCIIFEFSPDSNQGAFLEHLQRDYTMMGHINAIITLFTLKGDVLHQNAGSIAYYGYQGQLALEKAGDKRRGSGAGGCRKRPGASIGATLLGPCDPAWSDQDDERPVLTRLFQHAPPDTLEGMLESMVQGGVWRSILPVPTTLATSSRPFPAPGGGGGGGGDLLNAAAGVPPGGSFMGPEPDSVFTMDGLAFTGVSALHLTQPCDERYIGNRMNTFEGSFTLGTTANSNSCAAGAVAAGLGEYHSCHGAVQGHGNGQGLGQAHVRSMCALKAVPEQSQEHERLSFAQHRPPGSVDKGEGGGGHGRTRLSPNGDLGGVASGPPGSGQTGYVSPRNSPRTIRASSISIYSAVPKAIRVPRRSTTFSAVPSVGGAGCETRACSVPAVHGVGPGAGVAGASSFTTGPMGSSSPRLSRIRRRSGLPLGLEFNQSDALSQSTWGLFGSGLYEHRYERMSRDAGGTDAPEHSAECRVSAGRSLLSVLAKGSLAAEGVPAMAPGTAAPAGVPAAAPVTVGPFPSPVATPQRPEPPSPLHISPSQSSQVDQWQQWQYRHSQWQDALQSQSQPSQNSLPGRLINQPQVSWFLQQQQHAGSSQSSSSAAIQSINSSSRRPVGGVMGGALDGGSVDAAIAAGQHQISFEGVPRRQRSVALGEGMSSPMATARSTPSPSAGSLVSPQPSAYQHTDSNLMVCTTFVATAGNAPLDPAQLRTLPSQSPGQQPSRFLAASSPVGSLLLAPGAPQGGAGGSTAAIAPAAAAGRSSSPSLEYPAQPLRQLMCTSPSVPAAAAAISLSTGGSCSTTAAAAATTSGIASAGIRGVRGGSNGAQTEMQLRNNFPVSASTRRAPMRQSERSNPNLVLPRAGSTSTGTSTIKSATSFSFGSKVHAASSAAHPRPLVRMMSFLNSTPVSGPQQQQHHHHHRHYLSGYGGVHSATNSAVRHRRMVKRATSGQFFHLVEPLLRNGMVKANVPVGDGSTGNVGPVSSQNGVRFPPSTFLCGSFRRSSIRTGSVAALGCQPMSEVDESSSMAVITTMATLGTSREAAGGDPSHSNIEAVGPGHAAAAEDDEVPRTYHEITATPFLDPVSKLQVVMVVQTDVTARVQLEKRLADVMEAEHKLLENIFPRHVLEHIAHSAAVNQERASQFSLRMLSALPDLTKTATDHEQVTILFADIVGFTSMCKEVPAKAVMKFLNDLYTRFDTLLDIYGVYKVETIGDCYMVAGGLISKDADGFAAVRKDSCDNLQAWRVLSFAKAMLRDAQKVLLPTTQEPVKLRVGIHTGPVVSGVVGTRMPRFCLFGDTINTASRMESTCPYGRIQVSAATHALVPGEDWEPTGGVQVKGKGVMKTYLLRQSPSMTLPNTFASASMSTPGLPDGILGLGHGSSNLSRAGVRIHTGGGASAVGSGTGGHNGGGAAAGGGGATSTSNNAASEHGVVSAVTEKIPTADGMGLPPSGSIGVVGDSMGVGVGVNGSGRNAPRLSSNGGKNPSFLFNTVW